MLIVLIIPNRNRIQSQSLREILKYYLEEMWKLKRECSMKSNRTYLRIVALALLMRVLKTSKNVLSEYIILNNQSINGYFDMGTYDL